MKLRMCVAQSLLSSGDILTCIPTCICTCCTSQLTYLFSLPLRKGSGELSGGRYTIYPMRPSRSSIISLCLKANDALAFESAHASRPTGKLAASTANCQKSILSHVTGRMYRTKCLFKRMMGEGSEEVSVYVYVFVWKGNRQHAAGASICHVTSPDSV